jgi:hypothetical protein
MKKIDLILEIYPDESFIQMDGLDEAIVGVTSTYREGIECRHLVYSEDKIINIFVEEGMTADEAMEFYEYNTVRALPYMGTGHPIIISNPFEDEQG